MRACVAVSSRGEAHVKYAPLPYKRPCAGVDSRSKPLDTMPRKLSCADPCTSSTVLHSGRWVLGRLAHILE